MQYITPLQIGMTRDFLFDIIADINPQVNAPIIRAEIPAKEEYFEGSSLEYDNNANKTKSKSAVSSEKKTDITTLLIFSLFILCLQIYFL
jgi:hypothetical protein